MSEMKMSCEGGWGDGPNAEIFSALYSVLEWCFCSLFGVREEKREVVKTWIAQECWAREAVSGDEMEIFDKGVSESKKAFGEFTPSMGAAIDALATIVQILNRQGKVAVSASVAEGVATIDVGCSTAGLQPRSGSPAVKIKIIDKKKIRFVIKA